MKFKVFLFICSLMLFSCSPITPSISHQYQLTSYSHTGYSPSSKTILVSMPEAVDDYRSSDMKYTKTTYDLKSFSKNAWTAPPAKMLYPLLIQSLQSSHHFRAVIAGYWADTADYRVDTQLLEFKQDFTTTPSRFKLKAKVTITKMCDNKIILSKVLSLTRVCTADTPYGGVIAANKATLEFMHAVTQLAIRYT